MTILLFFLMILFVTALAVGGIYALYQVLLNFQPGQGQIRRDLRKMQADLRLYIDELVPWNSKEMDLLSLNQVNRRVKKGITTNARGVITSIYHEPMIAWAYKRYLGKDENALLYARTSHREFIYRLKKGQVEIQIDGQLVGTLRENGVLYSAQNQRLMARINRPNDELLRPILVGDREVGSVIDPAQAAQVNPRALEFVSQMSAQEEAVFLSLAIFEMLQPNQLSR